MAIADNAIAPVIRTVTVTVPPTKAFAVFTERIGQWWPLEIHGVFHEEAEGVVFEPHVGGHVFELSSSGESASWAEVMEYDPPRRLVLAWRPNRDRPAPTTIEVTFTPVDEGTKVELVHTGWERLGVRAVAQEARDSYNSGWPETLRRFAEATASE